MGNRSSVVVYGLEYFPHIQEEVLELSLYIYIYISEVCVSLELLLLRNMFEVNFSVSVTFVISSIGMNVKIDL